MIVLTVKHCIFSERLVSGAAPWFDSTASEMYTNESRAETVPLEHIFPVPMKNSFLDAQI